jgi:hypothetical protein
MPVAIPDFTDTDRHRTGPETDADPRDCATTLLRVKIPLVPSDARTVAEGTGGAR